MTADEAERSLYVLHLRPARQRARTAAAAEARALFRDLDAELPPGGPLAERPVLWAAVPATRAEEVAARLPRLGYTSAVDLLEPVTAGGRAGRSPKGDGGGRRRPGELVRWRGGWYRRRPVYREEDQASTALERRTFLLEVAPGSFREIRGYRGDSSPTGRRGLPYYDARLLVNLAFSPRRGRLLDPFAGAGGVVVEAVESGWQVIACDRDPSLRRGLAALGAASCVADAARLPFAGGSMRAVASEPPYTDESRRWLLEALTEMVRVLEPGGRLALLVAMWQADLLQAAASRWPLRALLSEAIDRKGLPVAALAWERT